jgi:hypothetical protein
MLYGRPFCASVTLSNSLTVLVATLSSGTDSHSVGQQVSYLYETQNFSENLSLNPSLSRRYIQFIDINFNTVHPSGHQTTGYMLLLKAASHEFPETE